MATKYECGKLLLNKWKQEESKPQQKITRHPSPGVQDVLSITNHLGSMRSFHLGKGWTLPAKFEVKVSMKWRVFIFGEVNCPSQIWSQSCLRTFLISKGPFQCSHWWIQWSHEWNDILWDFSLNDTTQKWWLLIDTTCWVFNEISPIVVSLKHKKLQDTCHIFQFGCR